MPTVPIHRAVIILDFARCIAMWLAAFFLSLFAAPRPQRVKKKLLIIRLDAIGDFVLWLDAAQGLRRLYPPEQYEITLLGNHIWTSLAEKLPWFDRVWPLERKKYLLNPLYFLRMLLKVRDGSFDIVINPTFSREFKFGDILARASQAPLRIGSTGDLDRIRPWQRRISDRWYTRLIPAQDDAIMELERNADFMRGLGAETFQSSIPELPPVSGLPPGFTARDYVAIIPGAGTPAKQWPLQRFSMIAARIHRKTGWPAVICGGPGDGPLGKTILEECAVPMENWCARTSLPELVAVLAGARLVIANDTGAVHIAAALSVPVICIMGGGHPGRFLPYRIETQTGKPLPIPVVTEAECFGCGWRHCREAHSKAAAPCIAQISVDAVWRAVDRLLDRLASGVGVK
ncbi:MAG TPA: glycosyltransferase family 9 protein [Syntrophales bacterium]|nr:glycosyltransferase family 9 protein [Syntrophales bacterium]